MDEFTITSGEEFVSPVDAYIIELQETVATAPWVRLGDEDPIFCLADTARQLTTTLTCISAEMPYQYELEAAKADGDVAMRSGEWSQDPNDAPLRDLYLALLARLS